MAKIRDAQIGDITAIIELNSQLADYHRALDTYYKPGEKTRKVFCEYIHQVLEKDKESVKVLVAEDTGIIGYCIGAIKTAQPFVVCEKIGKISHTFVKEEYRNRGIGKKMIRNLLKWFAHHGITRVELTVDSKNKKGIKAWECMGFKEYKKKMNLNL